MAQTTTADSVLTVTDTSIITNTNITVNDSSGNTTLFAGGQQSSYSGMVGVGTNSPSAKLMIYDDTKASLRISQLISGGTSNVKKGNGGSGGNAPAMMMQSSQQQPTNNIMGSNGQPINNFDINFINEPTGDGIFNNGTVVIGTSSDENQDPPQGSDFEVPSTGTLPNWVHGHTVPPDPCNTTGPTDNPSTAYHSFDYGWYTSDCPLTHHYSLKMYLDHAGNLSLEKGGHFGDFVDVDGNTTWTSNSWRKALRIGDANALEFNTSGNTTGTKYGMGATSYDNNFYLFSTTAEDNSQAANYHFIMTPTGDITFKGGDFVVQSNSGNKIFEVHQADGYTYMRDLWVTPNSFPDYVFKPDYKLKPLKEVEAYINTNHHLPEVPTETDIKAKGMQVGEMQTILLKKMEELTLYMIQLQKENEQLKKEVANNTHH